MAKQRLGIIMNGVTGRMGMNQHLVRSIVAIRAEGGVALANGDRFLVLVDGRRYEGEPGSTEYRIAEFERYAMRVETSELVARAPTTKTTATQELLANRTAANMAELSWRLGLPISVLLLSLLAICLLSALAFGALGLLLASRTQTIEGASGLMNLVMLPMWIFSGVFFSSARFPDELQPFIQALPLTAVNDALRASMLEGAGWTRLTPELAIVSAWMVLSFTLAVRLFRWR